MSPPIQLLKLSWNEPLFVCQRIDWGSNHSLSIEMIKNITNDVEKLIAIKNLLQEIEFNGNMFSCAVTTQ